MTNTTSIEKPRSGRHVVRRTLLFAIMGLGLCAVALLIRAAFSELTGPNMIVERGFSNKAAIAAAPANERAWLPPNLPPLVRYINERHNVDTNMIWGRFYLDNSAEWLSSSLEPVRGDRTPSPPSISVSREYPVPNWWADFLDQSGGWNIYKSGEFYFATKSAGRQEIYFWAHFE
jgi:hypothetical protein